jgi:hypothetical protein
MSHDDHQGHVQMFGSIFNASQNSLIRHGSRDSNHEKIAQALAENQLGRHARVRARQHGSERVLPGGERSASGGAGTRQVETALEIPLIAGPETFQRSRSVDL